jgi:uncharacterized protein YoaH (UPF0181 family)
MCVGFALRKGFSVDQADALVAEAMRRDAPSNTPRAIALVVRELREKRNMFRWALSRASGLSVWFVVQVESGKANPSLADVARLSLGLECDIVDFVQLQAVKRRLDTDRILQKGD